MVTTSAAPPPRDLYPFEGRRFDRGGGIRMHFLDEGQGPPVVLLHGNPSWSFLWRDLVKDLRRDHRCVAPDHVGCGLSDAPGAGDYGYALGDRIADVDALLRHLGIGGRVTLVLHDWGGMIGMAFDAWMMVPGWVRFQTTPEQTGVCLATIVDHIDHICQLVGNARHVGIGSDLDGGYGKEQTAIDLETIADLQKLTTILAQRGYSVADIEGIMHGNWIRKLSESLPT